MTPDLLRKSPLVRYRSGKPSNLPPLRYAPCIRPRIPFFLLLFDTWRWNRDRQSSLSFFLQKAKGNGTFSIKLSKSLVKRRQLQFRPLDHKYGIDVYKWPGSAKVTSASLPNIYIMVLDDKERKKALKDVRRRQLTSLFVRLSISLWNGPRRERERRASISLLRFVDKTSFAGLRCFKNCRRLRAEIGGTGNSIRDVCSLFSIEHDY